eukprot:scaffold27646_cov36-Prasinocladus_malaysianus.AAC.3
MWFRVVSSRTRTSAAVRKLDSRDYVQSNGFELLLPYEYRKMCAQSSMAGVDTVFIRNSLAEAGANS